MNQSLAQANRVDSERLERTARLAAELRARGLDAIVIDSAANMRYLFGYAATAVMYQCCIVTADADVRGVVREIDSAVFSSVSWVDRFATYADWQDPIAVLTDELRDLGLEDAVIGLEFDSNFLAVRNFLRIAGSLPHAKFKDAGGIVTEMRATKSASEIKEHRRAARIADHAMQATFRALAEGVTQRELMAAGYSAALLAGADNNAPRIMLLSAGADNLRFHGNVEDSRIRPGEPVHIELLPQVNGYSSRLMRSAVAGSASRELLAAFDELRRIQEQQFQALRPGTLARDVDKIGRDALLASGLRDSFANNTGYGLGLLEAPVLGDFSRLFIPTAEWRLAPNMVFHMYLSARGIGVSETLRITDDGYERLTHSERELKVVAC